MKSLIEAKRYSPGVIYNAPIVAFDVNANDISFPNGNVDYSALNENVKEGPY